MRKILAAAVCCCVTVVMAMASSNAAAADGKNYVPLPESSIAAQAPSGWVCDSRGSLAAGREVVSVLSCLPKEGGVPVSLNKMIGTSVPTSLDNYLQSRMSDFTKAPPGTFVVQPHKIDISGRPAIESASRGQAIMDFSAVQKDGKSAAMVEMISNDIVFRDKGAFYECALSTTQNQYTEALRRTYHEFCNSLKFDAN